MMTIPIIMCTGCSDHGRCDYTRTRPSQSDSLFQYAVCECQPAYSGDDCERELDACEDNPCLPEQTCTDLTAEEQGDSIVGYNCTGCPDGLTLGSTGCVDVNECADPDLHGCSHICINFGGSYRCECPSGYSLTSNQRTCLDVNECRVGSAGCLHICHNTAGSFYCQCQDGYSLAEDGRGCNVNTSLSTVCDSEPCAQGCRPELDTNTNSITARCFCFAGFQLGDDDSSCTDVDECQQNPCPHVCTNTEGSYVCSCHSGYQLGPDRQTCSPCQGLSYGPQCSLTCSCLHSASCHHVTGCVCPLGWRGQQCQEDVDECTETPDVCGEGQVCSNTLGSYTCNCRQGYVKDVDGQCVGM